MHDELNRRDFIKTSAASAAGAAVAMQMADGLAAPTKPRIVVARGAAVVDTDALALKRMQAALDKWGGVADLLKGKRVMIKINATDGGYRDANTSSQTTTALLKLVNDCAPKSVTVLGQEWNGWKAKRKGLPTLAEVIKNAKATLYNLPRYWTAGSEKAYKLIDPQPPLWKELMVAKELFEDDTVTLNLARLKTHPHCVFTGVIKNIIGLTRRMYGFHKVDERTEVSVRFDPAKSDGWHVFPQKLGNAHKLAVGPQFALNILDAGEPCFGWRGPGKQRIGAFPAGVTVVGKDALAIDVFGCKLLGEGLNKKTPGLYPEPLADWGKGDSDYITFNKTKTNYLKACADLGVGEADLSKVDVQEVQG
ncbi:DUF362 domain-containing protein [bacterium]|nr:DUF362 domain-containing protein [bacterium]